MYNLGKYLELKLLWIKNLISSDKWLLSFIIFKFMRAQDKEIYQ